MSSLVEQPILVVPAVQSGRGGGHLVRSADLVRSLKAAGRQAYLYLTSDIDNSSFGELTFSSDRSVDSVPWSFIVLDLFRIDAKDLRRWSALAPLVGLDAGGPARDGLDYLVDILPGLPGKKTANQNCPFLLPKPAAQRPSFIIGTSHPAPRALVSFGAEDTAGLSVPAALSLAATGKFVVDLLFGPRNRGPTRAEQDALDRSSVRTLPPEERLREHLAEYDVLVTHFGLTAFEALGARVPVLIVSPTAYHQRLAVAAGLPSAGIGRAAAAGLGKFFLSLGPRTGRGTNSPGIDGDILSSALGELARLASIAAERYGVSGARPSASARVDAETGRSFPSAAEGPSCLPGLVRHWSFPSRGRCPLCGSLPPAPSRSIARFPGRTYRRCATCGIVHLVRPDTPPLEYGEDYFFADYQRQYGVTYMEDFPKLKALGAVRVTRIASLLGFSPTQFPESGHTASAAAPKILDVGCAYGPFLAAAREKGFSCAGVDPAEGAVVYVANSLGIPALRGFFPDILSSPKIEVLFGPGSVGGGRRNFEGSLDAISFWYVIEHLVDLGAALRAAAKILRPGGILAFSTPSFSGISARVRRREYVNKSPQDHWTLWEVGRTGEFLKRFGFTLAQTRVTGHHPERFPIVGPWVARKQGGGYRLLSCFSEVFGLGDTFEAYAVKTEERGYHAE